MRGLCGEFGSGAEDRRVRSVGRSATRRPGALIQPCVNASGSEEVESLEALRPLAIHDVSR
jgi:hypothetical protein